ncbi:MAG: sugar ABC transporter permease [Pseudomonadota bacterium]|nr:sugar ABC transporter permease [Pseudomonadota bacterium]
MRLAEKSTDGRFGAALALTYLAFSAVFWAYPFVWLLILSFSEWRFFDAPTYSGLHNLFVVMRDPEFWNGLWNVIRFFAIFFPIAFLGSLGFAFGLQHVRHGKTFVALCFLLANISSGVAFSLVFKKLFSSTGPINNILFAYFDYRIPWLSNPNFAMLAIALVVSWKFVGYYGLILYSGLQTIPDDIYDAALLDHVSPLRRLVRITLPMINAQLIMVLVFTILVSFSIFTEAYLITGGGPLDSTSTPMMIIYETAFRRLQPSHAAIMSIIVAVVSYALIRLMRLMFEREVKLA